MLAPHGTTRCPESAAEPSQNSLREEAQQRAYQKDTHKNRPTRIKSQDTSNKGLWSDNDACSEMHDEPGAPCLPPWHHPKCWQKGRTFFMHLANMLETPDWLFISGPAEVIISSTGLNWLSVYVRPQGPVNFLESLFGIGQSVHMCPFPLMHITWGHKYPLGNKYYEITSIWTGADKHDWTKGESRQRERFCAVLNSEIPTLFWLKKEISASQTPFLPQEMMLWQEICILCHAYVN